MAKICVTGGAGFIGSNLVKKLLEIGHAVIVIDNLETGKLENIKEFSNNKNFEFVKASILDKKLDNVLKCVDYVFHEAALVDIIESIKNPSKTYNTNVLGTLNILKSSINNDIKKIIFASSCAIYGDKKNSVKESMSCVPQNPYVISKIIGESLISHFFKEHGLKGVILRYFNVYGPKQNMTTQYSAVIPKFISSALNSADLSIHGDGKQTRDFVFIEDVTNANILAMENKRADGKVFNIGFGKSISVNDLAKRIIELIGSNSNIIHVEQRPNEIRYSLADITLAKSVLKYTPSYDIERGLKKTIDWFRAKQSK